MADGPLQLERVAIVGVGLIGGSIAQAVKARFPAVEVTGVGRDPARLIKAQKLGIIDAFQRPPVALRDMDLVVVCTPVDRLAEDVLAALDAAGPQTIVTDAGSTKQQLLEAINRVRPADGRFVGSHPLAGSHLTGFEHADPRLFEGRLCIVTPSAITDTRAITRVESFWQAIGMNVRRMTAVEHDRVLALTSHLPHLAAAALAQLVDEQSVPFAATGFRDTTRVAGGSPDLWTAIFDANRDQMLQATDLLLAGLQRFRDLIDLRDLAGIREQLADAQKRRALYDACHGAAASSPRPETQE